MVRLPTTTRAAFWFETVPAILVKAVEPLLARLATVAPAATRLLPEAA